MPNTLIRFPTAISCVHNECNVHKLTFQICIVTNEHNVINIKFAT